MKRHRFKIPIFTSKQQKGILALVLFIILLQGGYYFYVKYQTPKIIRLSISDENWLNQQKVLDSLQKVDTTSRYKIYPFNPNFISDFKGYQLGMSVAEIDRLHQFRESNKYVNSAKEFQNVTKISDSLLQIIEPYFKFPEWTQSKKNDVNNTRVKSVINFNVKKNIIELKELNSASLAELKEVFGIGDVLGQRILDEQKKYNGFADWQQLDLVYGLKPEVIRNLQTFFSLSDKSQLLKVDINNASIEEITKLPYLKYSIAKDIVIYRSKFGDFKSINDLLLVSNFPTEKAFIIQHYLIF